MTDTTDTAALIDRLRSLAKTATPGKWWIDSHGEALVAFTDEGMKTVLKPEHLREKAHRDESTGGLSYWPNDSDASWIAAAQPQNIIALLDRLEAERQRAAGSEEELHKALHREKAAERKLLAAQEDIAQLKAKLANPVVLPPVEIEQGVCILCGKLHPTGLQCPMLRVTADKGIL